MNTFTRLKPSDFHVMPWKNGLGYTLELAIEPPRRGDGLHDFDWRVSIATVASDGPFSSFPGYERVILVLEGNGMVLRHGRDGGQAGRGGLETPAQEVRLGRLEPHRFQGHWTTTCTLIDGPVRDFNVMSRHGVASSVVEVLRPGPDAGEHTLEGSSHLLYCQAGRCDVALTGGTMVEVAAGELLRLDARANGPGAERVSIRGDAGTEALLVTIA